MAASPAIRRVGSTRVRIGGTSKRPRAEGKLDGILLLTGTTLQTLCSPFPASAPGPVLSWTRRPTFLSDSDILGQPAHVCSYPCYGGTAPGLPSRSACPLGC